MRVAHCGFDVGMTETILPHLRWHGNLIHDRRVAMAECVKAAASNPEAIAERMQLAFAYRVSVPRSIVARVKDEPRIAGSCIPQRFLGEDAAS